jgi:hypothetical protein
VCLCVLYVSQNKAQLYPEHSVHEFFFVMEMCFSVFGQNCIFKYLDELQLQRVKPPFPALHTSIPLYNKCDK